ncbi:MAG: DUF3536 domain-containing protein [Elusimicrobia bacterium]|nr:DUF3536 domain-containing protein [Candidatus Obscuribacterium magneticum]
MERYICIHGHFYQPPRENAWLEAIELQDSAFPYHDWNERITAECYAPDTAARILDEKDRIIRILNNYTKISFDFGPTLLNWMEDKSPRIYQAILQADKASQKIFSGHGSALAQCYHHVIMPLATRNDKYTQVLWGLRDFERRFQRKAEGMWLPETAVDLESLDIMAELGVKFTILAPGQASRSRKIGARNWKDVAGAKIDPTMPYLLTLPSGRTITLFFYDGPVSRAVAFEGLLNNGENFAKRLNSVFSDARTWPELVHIATDGESYGHHHRYGEMALAYALQYIESNHLAKITNYGQYLELFPPTHEVEIFEKTSWSCFHGVGRWNSNCGCNSGLHKNWTQAWRAPLRESLDWLRDAVNPRYEAKAREFFHDPWAARNGYIEFLFNRDRENLDQFLGKFAHRILSEPEKITVLKLMELERHLMMMYTSCGWFFDDLSGIEAVQIIQYAARAIQLAEQLFGENFENQFIEKLSVARSNVPEHGDGRLIYEKFVNSAKVDLLKVGAHYAMSSLFADYAEGATIYCYTVDREDHQVFEAGKAKLAVGRVTVTSLITWETAILSFGVLSFGDHNVNGGVREYQGEASYQTMIQDVTQAFFKADLPETLRAMDRHFLHSSYSLKTLFGDEQRRIFNTILEATLNEIEAVYRQIYENHATLMRFLADLMIPLPKALQTAAEFVLNMHLRRYFESDNLDLDGISGVIADAKANKINLASPGLGFSFQKSLEKMMSWLKDNPYELSILENLESAVNLLSATPFDVDLWEIQNNFYEMLQMIYPIQKARMTEGDETAPDWIKAFESLGHMLHVRVP